MAIQVGPCDPWPVNLCCDIPDGLEQADVDRWTMVASQLLWALSGRRWGPCPVTVRPCRKTCFDTVPSWRVSWGTVGPWVPYIGTDGLWRNASVCGCRTDCSCTELCEVYLPGPVYDVQSVTVDGVVLVPEAYRVDAPGRLVRTDGECWPECQDMAAPAGEEGTFAVTYRWGLPLTEAAVAAVSELTCHLLRGCAPGGCGCKINRSLTRISRQGVDMELPDPTALLAEGLTGLPLVDLWLTTVNPDGLTSPSRVYSPDYRPPRVQTWP
ncbi:hypothetical protein GCM10010387_15490 [Streptomyces inusitatus]|uniref:Head-to-tail adaptor n=1 Tax=Streptomyces inusitatus TaxID=68221 RepID=A0A918UNQ6_9ACTN|nr:hypothetical protein [Streptomyces inusitatus]GGZ23275.1 hypothetical protein GCM10010387_15490 [Streptomyces inusitatus]